MAAANAARRVRRAVQRHDLPTTGAGAELPNLGRYALSRVMAGPQAMGDVAHGRLDPMSPEGIMAAHGAAMTVLGQSPFAMRGAMGVGGGKLGGAPPPISVSQIGLKLDPKAPPVKLAPFSNEWDLVHPDTGKAVSVSHGSPAEAVDFWNKNHGMYKDYYEKASTKGGPLAPPPVDIEAEMAKLLAQKPKLQLASLPKPPPIPPPPPGHQSWLDVAGKGSPALEASNAARGMPIKPRENPLSAEEILSRRAASPYQTPVYRGLTQPPKAEGPWADVYGGYGETYTAANPKVAGLYAHVPVEHELNPSLKSEWGAPEGSNVVPLMLDTSKYHSVDAGGKTWGGTKAEGGGGNLIMRNAINHARDNGLPGVIVRNIFDEPAGNTRELGRPTDVYIPLDRSTARLPWAEFDPAKFHMKDLLASGAGLAVPAGLAGQLLVGSDGALHHVHDAPEGAKVPP